MRDRRGSQGVEGRNDRHWRPRGIVIVAIAVIVVTIGVVIPWAFGRRSRWDAAVATATPTERTGKVPCKDNARAVRQVARSCTKPSASVKHSITVPSTVANTTVGPTKHATEFAIEGERCHAAL